MVDYIFAHSNNLHPIQKKIIKYNESLGYVKKLQISVLQANFIQFLIQQKKFKNCLEIGTFTGYSALSIALSLPSNGKLYAIDKDKKNTDVALNFFKQAKVNRKINVEVNNALVALKNLKKKKKKFDLILIDADKENYINYFNQSLSLINKDGIILIDNILWKGEVANPSSKDKITMKIKEFNNYIKNKNINKYILPIGDGFFVCWK
ncbi:MAG: methyltransferase domain-containing protein [Proteobacteria bacterium]|nr:methyltransferase domain-containing protein [Pseudomonadota bacterium]